MDTLYIVMPAYNEEANLRSTVSEWYPVILNHNASGNSRLVVFNDGSKDSTAAIGKELEKDYPLFKMVNKPNSGHGATLLFAYKYAIKHGADYIFQTDSDGQTRPDEFEQFWQQREQYRALIGCRCNRQDGASRIFVTKVLKLVLRIVFGLDVPDANTPFRLMQRELLTEYIPDIPKGFNLSNVMLTVLFLYNEEAVKFIPITFRQRQGGTNSINLRKIVKIGIKALDDFYTIKIHMKKHSK